MRPLTGTEPVTRAGQGASHFEEPESRAIAMKCQVCEKFARWWGSLTTVSHTHCKTIPLLRQIDR